MITFLVKLKTTAASHLIGWLAVPRICYTEMNRIWKTVRPDVGKYGPFQITSFWRIPAQYLLAMSEGTGQFNLYSTTVHQTLARVYMLQADPATLSALLLG